MDQKSLRTRLKTFMETEGVRQKHIANETNITESLLSRFKNGRVDLFYKCDIQALDNYLISKGY